MNVLCINCVNDCVLGMLIVRERGRESDTIVKVFEANIYRDHCIIRSSSDAHNPN